MQRKLFDEDEAEEVALGNYPHSLIHTFIDYQPSGQTQATGNYGGESNYNYGVGQQQQQQHFDHDYQQQ